MTTAASASEPITGTTAPDNVTERPAFETNGMVPLIIGATGDVALRDRDVPRLQGAVREFIGALRSKRPPTPIVVLSSLADGAERLVAQLAVDEFQAALVVPLPMAQADYEASFRDDASRDDFRSLLRSAARAFEVDGPECDDGAFAGARIARGKRRAGAYVARNCQILIALWDGVDSEDAGGPCEVVRFQREGVPAELDPAHSPLDLPESGPVYHIRTPGPNDDPTAPIACEWLHPLVSTSQEDADRAFGRMYHMIEEYNADVTTAAPAQANLEQSAEYLLPKSEWASLTRGLRQILQRYALADALALRFQRRMYRALNLLTAGAFLVAVLMQIHAALRRWYPISGNVAAPWYAQPLFRLGANDDIWLAPYDVPYLLVLFAVVALYRWSSRRGDQNKYLDYRAVAEGLRVQFYWRLAGLADLTADHYLRKQKGELDWIRGALRVVDIMGGPCNPADDAVTALRRLHLVTTHWVDDQIHFFVGKAQIESAHGRRARLSRGLLRWLEGPDSSAEFVGRAQARKDEWKSRQVRRLRECLLLFVIPAFAVTRGFAPGSHPLAICLVLVSALLVLIGVQARIRSFSDHAKQYSRMGITFSNARKHLSYLLDSGALPDERRIAAARALLRELGTEALAENGDWVLLHRERPLELPRV